MYVAGIRGIPAAGRLPRIKYLSDLCGLKDIMHKSIGELSKGLNQRVGLAHAMMNDPEILILDEPTQGLDPNQIVEIRNIIRRIGQEKTIIFSTHILSEAEATCDRIMIINRGRIVADGDTKELRLSGQGTVIHMTLKNAQFDEVKKNLINIDGVEKVEKTGTADDGLMSVTITCRAGNDLREPIYRKIKATDWTLMDFHQEAHTLEAIFRNLTCQ
jgi:ABC-2 type transport system ATP-binding protein